MVSIDSFPTLQTAAFALKTAKDTIITLRSHQERCRHLIERCERLIVDVCGQVKPNSSAELIRQLKIVERVCITVRDTITNLQNKGTVWRTLNKDNINRAFTAAEVELSDVFLIFNVGAHIIHNKLEQDLAIALQNDRQHILRYLDDLLKRSQLLADAFENRPFRRELPPIPSTSQAVGVSWSISPEDIIIGPEEEALIGSGTVGKVIKGRLGRKSVVVKKMHPDISRILSSSRNRRTLDAKFAAWFRLTHPNVASFVGSFVDHEHHFMVSEYHARGNILDYIQRHPEMDRVSTLHQVCSGMEYLHENLIIHGNLKASNLLVSKDHTVIVADYDLSWLIDDTKMSDSGSAHPTTSHMAYMAPEYLDGGDLEYHVDVYSFAITAWVLHTGCLPFTQIGWRKFRQKVVERKERPKKPESMNNLLWSAMERWWAHDPDERPTFVEIESFLRELTDFENGRPMIYRQERGKIMPLEILTIPPPSVLQMSPTMASASSEMDFGQTIPMSKAGQNALRESISALKKFTSVDRLIKCILLFYPNWLKAVGSMNFGSLISSPKTNAFTEQSSKNSWAPAGSHLRGVEGTVNKFKKTILLWIEKVPHLQGEDVANGNRTLMIVAATCVMAEHTMQKSSWTPYLHADKFTVEKLGTSELKAFLETSTRRIWSNYLRSFPRDEVTLLESLTQAVEHGIFISAS